MQVLHLPTQTITHAKNAIRTEEYNCTKCNGCLVLRNGKIRAPHFSHRIRCQLTVQSHINKPKISKCVHCNTECTWLNHDYIWIKEYADKVYYFKQDCELCKYGQIYLNQRGAGCGKTYESIQLMNDPRFQYKTTFIYLTKMHSAKEVIYTEIQEQEKKFKYLKMEKNDPSGKQYKISFLKKDVTINVLIGTIDSFTYAMADKSVPIDDQDYFRGIVATIQNGNIVSPELVKYAQQNMNLCRKTLVIIDEAQDLEPEYIKAFESLITKTNIDVYVIGDKLQSIWGGNNIYTYMENNDLAIPVLKNNGRNHVMRFHNEHFKPFVNSIIDFKKYGLPPIEAICNKPGCLHSDEIPYQLFKTDDYDYTSDKVIEYMMVEIEKHGYLPHNFMIIFPILKNNVLAEVLHSKIQRFWAKRLGADKHIYLHRSVEGQTINLKESEKATRILSIHTSKGNGCEVVFLLGCTEQALRIFSKQSGNLVYDSLLHVAITRQKKSLYIGLDNDYDDIYRRLKISI
jgi:hypothetical protein